jgi:DNA repair exonuclease SbcCD nuclease subunit
MGFDTKKKDLRNLDYLNKTLKTRNIKLNVIRGNHDNPDYFDGSINTSNISLLADYSFISVDGQGVLCIGGAISIDRKPNSKKTDEYGNPWKGRKEGVNYWSNEGFDYRPELIEDLKKFGFNIDIVITHSAPDFCEPRTKSELSNWALEDPGLIEECAIERNNLSKLYDQLKEGEHPPKFWCYGHFHFHMKERFEDTDFILLDVNEFHEVRI